MTSGSFAAKYTTRSLVQNIIHRHRRSQKGGGLRGLGPQRMRKKNIKASLINLTLNMRYKMTKKYQICHHQIRFFQAQNAPKSVFGRGSDREKVACWRTKAAISLKRVKIKRKSYCGRPIETQQRSFGRYHPWPFMASPSSRLGVCNLATPSYLRNR